MANVLAILGTVALALAMGSVVYVIASVLYTGGVVRVSAAAVVTLTALLWFALPFTALASGEPVARSRR